MRLTSLIAAAALALSAGLSAAQTPAPILLIPTSPGQFSATVVQPVDGLFIDTFSFVPGVFDGHVSVSLLGLSGPVSFFTANLSGNDFSYFPEDGATTFAFEADVTSAMPLTLTVFGAVLDANNDLTGPGSYSVSINAVAAVPEPQTYALLLAGLAVIGGVARRRSARVA